MQTKKAKLHLKRIETILNLHEDGLTRLDKDILLEDIRHLYDLVLDADVAHPVIEMPPARDHTYVEQIDTVDFFDKKGSQQGQPDHSPKVQQLRSDIHIKDEIEVKAENEVEAEVEAENEVEVEAEAETFNIPSATVHTPTTVAYEEKQDEHRPPIRETPYVNSRHDENTNGRSEQAAKVQAQKQDHADVMIHESPVHPELFDFPYSSDLSDRLANTKIEHLNEVLTINDKILYINHLFGGEAIPFQESLKKFEGFYTYEEAKKYASQELVDIYKWTNSDKFDTVRQFMRQVKRLYN